MTNFLHTSIPERILVSFGSLTIYWYGILIVAGILAAVVAIFKLSDKYGINKELIVDAIFYAVGAGLIGARLYHVLIEFGYYRQNPLKILAVWEGGLAIHGAILGGLAALWFFLKKRKENFWRITAVFAPGLALAQAFGRWGNYFNQELYGLPTGLPWGIPIEPANRLIAFYNSTHFHPAFLYESLGNLAIFILLIILHAKNRGNDRKYFMQITLIYIISYSILRFTMEFIRVDESPAFFGLRLPQLVSLLLAALSAGFLAKTRKETFPPKLPGLD